jgi:Holliday junction DNA helicase RuvA
MISRVYGKISEKKNGLLYLDTGGICYEIHVPVAVMKALEKEGSDNVRLITYHYLQMEQSKAVPLLIGFKNDVEKEFFEKFISVSGVGPKAACKALVEPFSRIASAINSGDTVFLKGLPGIGDQRAKLIVAKLQGKVGKYGLIRDEFVEGVEYDEDIAAESLDILIQLQYKRAEAEEMIKKALKRKPNVRSSEELLNEVYRERSS